MLFVSNQSQSFLSDVDDKNIQQTKQVIGKWQRCRTYYKEESREGNIISNVCLIINFNEDGKGNVLIGDELRLKFKWRIDRNHMIFSFDSSKEQSNFLSGITEYDIKQYYKEDLYYLELKDPNKEVIHFLTRTR